MLVHVCALATLGFAALVARLDASWVEVPLLAAPRDLPLLSIIVPARDEERSIEACVRSLLAQEWLNFEVIVVDDGSSDATPAILARLAIEDDRLRVVRGERLPADWVGKPWALRQGMQHARGEWLLFTDADSVHRPRGAASALAFALDGGADALTIGPYQELGSFWEQAVLPPILGMIMLATGPMNAVNDPMSDNALANGQYILVRRSAFEALGGLEALRQSLLEDVEFARLIKGDGRFRLLLAGGRELATVRMYQSLPEIVAGFTKNLSLGAGNPQTLAGGMLFCSAISFAPLLLGARALRAGRQAQAAEAFATVFAACAISGRGLARSGHRREFALLFPLGMSVLVGIGLNSAIRWYGGSGVEWRGRTYRRGPARP